MPRPDPFMQADARIRFEAAQVTTQPIVLASRHNFDPPLSFSKPQGHDPILQAAKPIIGTCSYRTFAGFLNPLHIEPLFSWDARWLSYATDIGSSTVAMYAIGRSGMMAKVPMMLVPGGEVLVQVDAGVTELGEWLKTLPASTFSLTGKRGYELMHQWYLASNQVLPIMTSVCHDVRVEILKHCVGYNHYPGSCSLNDRYGSGVNGSGQGSSGRHGIPGETWDPDSTLREVDAPNMSILMLSRQTNGEIDKWAKTGTRKCFQDASKFTHYLRHLSAAPLGFQHLRVLDLELDHRGFILFFRVNVPPFGANKEAFGGDHWHGSASAFATLPHLKELCLRFRSPLMAAALDPWARAGEWFGHARYCDSRGNRDRHGFHTSCQRIVID
ncbi:hypothetical protein LTR65_009043 [Meristemomyces frigidus]